jgi:hypothetical protein
VHPTLSIATKIGTCPIGHKPFYKTLPYPWRRQIIALLKSSGIFLCFFGARFARLRDSGGSGQEQRDMRRSDLVQHKEKEKGTGSRTSQIVFGERQHLLRVLDSLEGTDLPIPRAQQERRSLEELIHARTRELNQINTAWDEKIGLVLSADAKPEMLEKLAKQAPEEDFYLLRLISEHPRSNARTLQRLGRHPYAAIRENVARHPNADAATLTYLSKDRSQPLWYLVAFNPNTPTVLQRRLRERLKRLGENHATIR